MTATGIKGTRETRTLDWTAREHKDWVFGRAMGQSRWLTAADAAALVATPEGEARANKWTDSDFLALDWLVGEEEQTGPNGEPLLLSHVAADAGWYATQIWGFQNIGGERRYVRNVVVAKGDKFENFKMVYDFHSE